MMYFNKWVVIYPSDFVEKTKWGYKVKCNFYYSQLCGVFDKRDEAVAYICNKLHRTRKMAIRNCKQYENLKLIEGYDEPLEPEDGAVSSYYYVIAFKEENNEIVEYYEDDCYVLLGCNPTYEGKENFTQEELEEYDKIMQRNNFE